MLSYLVGFLLLAYVAASVVAPWSVRRKIRAATVYGLGAVGTLAALIPLLWLITYLAKEGAPGLNLDFFLQAEKPAGQPGGGFANAIVGSIVVLLMACAMGVPVGVLAGLYLAEVGKSWLADAIRFLAEVMTGLPSIIAGILGYTLIVLKTGHASGIAGALALSILMIPVITKVTEDALRMVPKALREASFGLGAGQAWTIVKVVLPAARSAILTGVVLAVARVGGETAPLLFTALGSHEIVTNPNQAMAALPLSVFQNSTSSYDVNIKMAISGAFFLVIAIALTNLVIRHYASRAQAFNG